MPHAPSAGSLRCVKFVRGSRRRRITDSALLSALQLRSVPTPTFSEDLRRACRERLLACLADLTTQTTLIKGACSSPLRPGPGGHGRARSPCGLALADDSKASKVTGVAADGRLWVSRVLATVDALEKDAKHVKPLEEVDEEDAALRLKTREVLSRLKDVSLPLRCGHSFVLVDSAPGTRQPS